MQNEHQFADRIDTMLVIGIFIAFAAFAMWVSVI